MKFVFLKVSVQISFLSKPLFRVKMTYIFNRVCLYFFYFHLIHLYKLLHAKIDANLGHQKQNDQYQILYLQKQ